MPKKGHTEEQIIAALKQHESGGKTVDICRQLAISQATFYQWKNNMPGWECRSCARCDNCGKRIAD